MSRPSEASQEEKEVAMHSRQVRGDPGYRFCPKCGNGLQVKVVKASEPARLVCMACDSILYLDPKVAVGAIATLGGKIVLLRRGIEPALGKWVFPGGFVDWGEAVEEAVVREAREEVNLDVAIDRLLNVYSYPGRPIVVIVYVVCVVGGALAAGDEALAVGTFSPDEIPWPELAFPSTRDALTEYLRNLARE